MKKSKWGLDVFSLDWELFVIYKNGLFFFFFVENNKNLTQSKSGPVDSSLNCELFVICEDASGAGGSSGVSSQQTLLMVL